MFFTHAHGAIQSPSLPQKGNFLCHDLRLSVSQTFRVWGSVNSANWNNIKTFNFMFGFGGSTCGPWNIGW